MTLLDIISKAAPAMGSVKALLEAVKKAVPDLAAQADAILAQLDAPVAADNLVKLAVAIPPELVNIAQGNIDPRPHAGDSI